MVKEEIVCQYSGLLSTRSYEIAEEDTEGSPLMDEDLDRIVEMAWEDRTPFEAIEVQFRLKETDVKALMKKHLKFKSYVLWRKRVEDCKTKHLKKRIGSVKKFKSKHQRAITLNRISKRKST